MSGIIKEHDTSSWDFVGQTTNTRFFTIEPGVLAGMIEAGARDTPTTAQENIDFYKAYFREHGRGVLIYVLGRITDQAPAARRLYSDQEDPDLLRGVALVAESLLARAVASFFLGLTRPKRVPLKSMGSLEEALRWAHELLEQA